MKYLSILLLFLYLSPQVYSEIIVMKNGKHIEGTIISEDDSEMEIQLSFGKIKIKKDEVDSVSYGDEVPNVPTPTPTPIENFQVEIVNKGMIPSEKEIQKEKVQEEVEDKFDNVYLAKSFLSLVRNLKFEEAVKSFDPAMQKAMPPQVLQELWKGVITTFRQMKEQTQVRKEKLNEFDIVFITCVFQNGSLDAKMVFNQEKQIAGLYFLPSKPPEEYSPPEYVNINNIDEKDLTIGNDEWKLPASLTFPKEGESFPVVVLVHGSGPQSRDEDIGPNKPFKDLAWGLASQGVAVLRYAKRTKVYAQEMFLMNEKLTVKEETIDDVLRALIMLRNEEGLNINKDKIFVLGHSLGGMLIPRIGKRDEKIEGFIVLAGNTRPLEDLMIEQMEYRLSLNKESSKIEQITLGLLKEQAKNIKSPDLTPVTPKTELLGVPARYWLDLRGYKPAEMAKELNKPMLILQGGRDYQVTEKDFQIWKDALSDKSNVEFKLYPSLNHIFAHGEGVITPSEYFISSHVDKTVIDDIANWVKAN